MNRRILIVEDDRSLRELWAYTLMGEGYTVFEADDGVSGLTMAKEVPNLDLILLDIQMPGMNGFDVSRLLQDDPVTVSIPVVFLTARATQDDKMLGFESGAVEYLTKPIDLSELKARVRALLRQSDLTRRLGSAEVDAEVAQAAAIQQSLLTSTFPSAPGMALYAECRPARQVGGDFYDFLPRGDGQIYLVEADVSGKGLPAALMMTSARTALRGAAQAAGTPATAVALANSGLYEDLTNTGKFVTAIIGYYSPETGELRYVNAGHSVVIHCSAAGPATILEADAPPLGVLDDYPFAEQSLALAEGDFLVICSDGFPEAANEWGEMFGYDPLLQAVDQLSQRPVAEIAHGLFAAVSTFAGQAEQADDQTVVIVKRTAA